MDAIIARFSEDKDFQSTVAGVENGLKEQIVSGLGGSSRALFTAALYRKVKRPIAFVTHNLNQAQKFAEDLSEFLSKEDVKLYPADEWIAADIVVNDPAYDSERIAVLSTLLQGFRGVLVLPYTGLRKKLVPFDVFRSAHITLSEGHQIEMEDVTGKLVETGYSRVDMVERKGEFSVRGGIVDVFPPSFDNPLRIEWFDDEIDTIRAFNVSDQRSLKRQREVVLPPARELFASFEQLYQSGDRLVNKLNDQLRRSKTRK